MNTFEDCLSVLIHFCESDSVFAIIHKQLIAIPGLRFDAWYEERLGTVGGMAGSGDLTFPKDADLRIGIMYEILRRTSDGRIQVYDFTGKFFAIGSNYLDEYIAAFNEAITRKLTRELSYRLEEMEGGLPEDSKSFVSPSTIQIIHSATNVIQQNAVGSQISQVANQNDASELARLFADLRRELAKSNIHRPDLSEVVDTAQEIAIQTPPKPNAVKALLSALPTTASLLSITASILKLIAA